MLSHAARAGDAVNIHVCGEGESASRAGHGGPMFTLCGPHGRLRTRGVAAALSTSSACSPRAAHAARELLLEHEERTGSRALLVGAIPFDPNMPAWLYVPEHFDRRPPSTRW